MRKKLGWLLVIILVVGVAGFFTYRALAERNSASATSLQTATVKLGTVTSAISSAGTVRSNQSATISWQTNGKVGEVKAQLGQQVAINEVLASLDANTLSQSIIQAQVELINAQEALEELKKPQPLKIAQAEIALEEAKAELENLLNPSDIAISQAEIAVINAQTAVNEAQKKVDQTKYGRGTDQQIASARASVLMAQDKVANLQEAYDRTPGKPEEDLAKANALANLTAAQNEYKRALAVLNWYLGSPNEEEVNEAYTQLALAKAQLAEAQKTLEKLKNPSAMDIELARAKVEEAQQNLETLKKGPTQAELITAETRLTLAQATLNQAYLTAPFSGAITEVQVLPGDIVSAGKPAFRIDDLSSLFIDLMVSEIDIHQIKVGQSAQITFDAIPGSEYSGTVTQIGLVASVTQGVVNYPVTIKMTNPDEYVLPGMTAAVSIIVAQHENVLVVPNQAIKFSGGQSIVTVLYQGQQIPIQVTVGLTGTSVSEVISDQLREGDTIVINASAAAASTSNFGRPGEGGLGFFGP